MSSDSMKSTMTIKWPLVIITALIMIFVTTISVWRFVNDYYRLPNLPRQRNCLALSPVGDKLVLGGGSDGPFGGQGFIKIYDIKTRLKKIAEYDGFGSKVTCVSFSPDGRFVACGTATIHRKGIGTAAPDVDGQVVFWDVDSNLLLSPLPCHKDRVLSIAYSPNGRMIATGSKGGEIKVWDIASKKEVLCIRLKDRSSIQAISFSNDGMRLISANEQELHMWDLRNGDCQVTLTGHRSLIIKITQSHANNYYLCSGDDNGTINLWDTNKRIRIGSNSYPGNPLYSMAFSPDGKWLAFGGQSQIVLIWDLTKIQEIPFVLGKLDGDVSGLLFINDGSQLIAASESLDNPATIRIWDVKSMNELQKVGKR